MKKELKTINWILFAIMIILIVVASLTGWINNSLYLNNTADLIIRSRFYDLVILIFAIPTSLILLFFLVRAYIKAKILILGFTVYFLFSYSVTIFTINQNIFFLIYVAIISLGAFYLSKEFHLILDSNKFHLPSRLKKWVALTLLFSAVSGFGYWIINSIISLTIQQGEIENMQVKAPQIFDMALALPFTIYGAIRLWRGEKNGELISLIMMIFFILIGLSVIIMELGLSVKTNTELDYGKVISYSVIALLNLIMAHQAYRKLIAN